jgi:hypothetical protein
MTELNQDLLFEILRKIQTDVSGLKQGLLEVRAEMGAMRGTMISMQQDIHNIYSVQTRHDQRLERIENRLELRELAEAQARFEPHP